LLAGPLERFENSFPLSRTYVSVFCSQVSNFPSKTGKISMSDLEVMFVTPAW